MPRVPDVLIWGASLAAILTLCLSQKENIDAPPAPPPPDAEEGALLGPSTPFDPLTMVPAPSGQGGATAGTAFAVSAQGRWITARHVVEGCPRAAILLGGGHAIPASIQTFPKADVALLATEGAPIALPLAIGRPLRIGQRGYAPGYPGGVQGEVAVRLIGRETLRVHARGGVRGETDESVLAWAEVGRTDGLSGSLAGLSGAPVLDSQGRVLGVVLAERPRRGRVYTTAPESVRPALARLTQGHELATGAPITPDNYGRVGDSLRRDLRVAQVVCLTAAS